MSAAVEAKVKAATAGSFVVSLLIMVLNAVVANNGLLKPLPAWLQAIVIALAPTLVTFLAGFQAPHTPRVAPAPEPPAAGGVSPAA
ncbi:holin [Streptomyces sp. NPDC054933]